MKNEWNRVKIRFPPTYLYHSRSLDEKVFYPFTFPITAGPGTLAVTITLSAHATQKTLFATTLAHAGILAAVILNCIGVYFSYA